MLASKVAVKKEMLFFFFFPLKQVNYIDGNQLIIGFGREE